MNFAVLWLFAKVFSEKFGGVAPLVLQKRAIRESENCIFHQFAKVFSLKSFPLYSSMCCQNFFIIQNRKFFPPERTHELVYFQLKQDDMFKSFVISNYDDCSCIHHRVC